VPGTDEGCDKQRMKRIEMNDPMAIFQEGGEQYHKGDYSSAFELYTKAAELGELEAHHTLSIMYHNGHGVEKDRGKEMHHLEVATIGGHPIARHNLGCHEWRTGNKERAAKHWTIAATQGFDESIKSLMDVFREEDGMVSKDDLAVALRAHQVAVDATKSPQRDAGEEFFRNLGRKF